MKFHQFLLCAFVAGTLQACMGAVSERDSEWLAPLHQDHALVGNIWRSSDQRFISLEELFQDFTRHRFILLGEKHDNPDHHRLQRFILQELQQNASLGAAVFEMLNSDQQDAVDTLGSVNLASEPSVREHLQWDDAGWEWPFYGPMLMDVVSAGVPVKAGNISRDEMMEIYQGEPDPRIADVLDAGQVEQLYRDIDESHCGMLPASQFPAMVRVQQARDARMAEGLLVAAEGAVRQHALIAGNFHVRRDLGVPNYLPTSEGSVAALAFMEVNPESQNPADYLQGFSERISYDYLWFTPAVTTEDYCASMRGDTSVDQ
ncbi:MAG: ChaN family lipoprotein [Gammaproteobacteria bacterium]|nr:ChaN family lipoprotein [Gammaproteobacteria bacterium]